MLAVQHTENVNIIQYLCNIFKNTIDINMVDKDGDTALMFAVKRDKNIEVIQYLCTTFKDAIDINKQNNIGQTTFVLAAQYIINDKVI